jgi:RNA polymerase sigma-70 factor (ECF subfamily)
MCRSPMHPNEPESIRDSHRNAEPAGGGDGDARLRVLRDDEAALEALFRAEYDGLCAFVERYVRGAAVAEELVQEIFLRLWRRRGVLPPAAVTRAYLYAAARNGAVQHIRHARVDLRWREAKAVGERPEPASQAADADLMVGELAEAAERAVASLPERCRMVYTLSRQQGLRYAEIAETLGIAPGTVEIHMNRAFKLLRGKLAPYLLFLISAIR